jgi:RNA polymerase primary sigma factor
MYRELGLLLDRAELQGHLSIQDVLELAPGLEEENLSLIVGKLKRRGVDILDEDDLSASLPADEANLGDQRLGNLEYIAAQDTVGLYLREMARVPLLSVEEETDLARRIEKGKQARQALKRQGARLDTEKRAGLETQSQDGLQARDHLIRANTRLVVSVAKRHIGRGLPLLDLIQEGNLGLMKAVEKFDYRRGFRFSTYATWWIRQTISRAVANQGRTIRVPVHMLDRIQQMYRAAHKLEQNLGRPPENEELAAALGLEQDKVQSLRRLSWTPLSLENPVGEEEDSELSMFVEDTLSPAPAQITQDNLLREKIEQVLATLSAREARIIRLRYGLIDGEACTLEEVGRRFGLSRERIRQIESKALRRLRHPCRARQLREYL